MALWCSVIIKIQKIFLTQNIPEDIPWQRWCVGIQRDYPLARKKRADCAESSLRATWKYASQSFSANIPGRLAYVRGPNQSEKKKCVVC